MPLLLSILLLDGARELVCTDQVLGVVQRGPDTLATFRVDELLDLITTESACVGDACTPATWGRAR
jgi:hypothetical protein